MWYNREVNKTNKIVQSRVQIGKGLIMENLMQVLENQFDVVQSGNLTNFLGQTVKHVIICETEYSIKQQDSNLFEVLDRSVDLNTGELVYEATSNLTADEAVSYFVDKSRIYLGTVYKNARAASHFM